MALKSSVFKKHAKAEAEVHGDYSLDDPGCDSLVLIPGGFEVAGRAMPSPYLAKPGMVTGSFPPIGISPNSAFTVEISATGTLL